MKVGVTTVSDTIDPSYYTDAHGYGNARDGSTAAVDSRRRDLPPSPGHPFYARLTTLLDGHHFDRFVEGLCARFYAPVMGRPSLAPGALLPPAAGRLLRRHRLGTRDGVARDGLVGGPQLSAVGRGRGATRSFDDCAHAALDRSGDAPDRLYVGATTTRRGRPADG